MSKHSLAESSMSKSPDILIDTMSLLNFKLGHQSSKLKRDKCGRVCAPSRARIFCLFGKRQISYVSDWKKKGITHVLPHMADVLHHANSRVERCPTSSSTKILTVTYSGKYLMDHMTIHIIFTIRCLTVCHGHLRWVIRYIVNLLAIRQFQEP